MALTVLLCCYSLSGLALQTILPLGPAEPRAQTFGARLPLILGHTAWCAAMCFAAMLVTKGRWKAKSGKRENGTDHFIAAQYKPHAHLSASGR